MRKEIKIILITIIIILLFIGGYKYINKNNIKDNNKIITLKNIKNNNIKKSKENIKKYLKEYNEGNYNNLDLLLKLTKDENLLTNYLNLIKSKIKFKNIQITKVEEINGGLDDGKYTFKLKFELYGTNSSLLGIKSLGINTSTNNYNFKINNNKYNIYGEKNILNNKIEFKYIIISKNKNDIVKLHNDLKYIEKINLFIPEIISKRIFGKHIGKKYDFSIFKSKDNF